MTRKGFGLTRLYNLINDPAVDRDGDIDRMRQVHAELDAQVISAYGWSDIRLDHGFHLYRQAVRWTVSPDARTEMIERLLMENHRRAR